MELEHAFQQSNFFLTIQLLFMGSLLVPGMLGRMDLYRRVVSAIAVYIVTFGPFAVLLYVLYEVSLLN